ncbi:unnamed protein product [Lactuca saligna]|uniref:Homeobox domain-containing protein n=1 Tax=Lactuca saligna TaxID=75948 RepID=A0AA35V9Z0_LACSI|nr:unnamed protein product [Lactuca saligna]
METQQQEQDLGNKNNTSYLCRQSSTRWTPTSDQIRILKELYYNNGIRSPTADQIQRIAARLRHYGKIEGKNVFYWFQNHKARERQKKRFTPVPVTPPPPPPPPSTATLLPSPFSDHRHHHHHMHVNSHHPPTHPPQFYSQQHKLYTTHQISPSEGGSSSTGFMPVGYGYGSVAMEKSFKECSISQGESRVVGGTSQNFGSWVGSDSYSYEKIKPEYEAPEEDDDRGGQLSAQMETLPLFPVNGGATMGGSHHDIINMKAPVAVESPLMSEHSNGGCYTGGNWFRSDGRTSLELSLSSYGYYN